MNTPVGTSPEYVPYVGYMTTLDFVGVVFPGWYDAGVCDGVLVLLTSARLTRKKRHRLIITTGRSSIYGAVTSVSDCEVARAGRQQVVTRRRNHDGTLGSRVVEPPLSVSDGRCRCRRRRVLGGRLEARDRRQDARPQGTVSPAKHLPGYHSDSLRWHPWVDVRCSVLIVVCCKCCYSHDIVTTHCCHH